MPQVIVPYFIPQAIPQKVFYKTFRSGHCSINSLCRICVQRAPEQASKLWISFACLYILPAKHVGLHGLYVNFSQLVCFCSIQQV